MKKGILIAVFMLLFVPRSGKCIHLHDPVAAAQRITQIANAGAANHANDKLSN